MATVIQIKRSPSATEPLVSQLSEGEMAYAQDKANDGTSAKLYIESVDSIVEVLPMFTQLVVNSTLT